MFWLVTQTLARPMTHRYRHDSRSSARLPSGAEHARARHPRRAHRETPRGERAVDRAGAVADVGAEVALEDDGTVAREPPGHPVERRLERPAHALAHGHDGTPSLDPARQAPHRLDAVAQQRGVEAPARGVQRGLDDPLPGAGVPVGDEAGRLVARVRPDAEAALGRRVEGPEQLGARADDLARQLLVEVEVRRAPAEEAGAVELVVEDRAVQEGEVDGGARVVGDDRHRAQQEVLDRDVAVAHDVDVGEVEQVGVRLEVGVQVEVRHEVVGLEERPELR